MLKKISKDQRLSYRNLENGLIIDLHTRYSLPIAAAARELGFNSWLKLKAHVESQLEK